MMPAVARAEVGSPMAAPSSHPSTTVAAPPQEAAEYREAYGLYVSGSYDVATQKLAAFEKSHPQSALLPQAENLAGMCFLLTRRAPQAIEHFKRSIEANGTGGNTGFKQYVIYNLASAQFDAGMLEDAQQSLTAISLELIDKENRIKVLYLKARLFSKRGSYPEAARETLAATRLIGDLPAAEARDIRGTFFSLLDQSLKEVNSVSTLESLYRDFEDSPFADAVLFRLGSKEVSDGARDKGETHLRALMSRFPQSTYYMQATDLIRAPENTGPVDASAVGVLLPMKGKFSKFGQKSLQGIELAFRIFNEQEPDSKVTLVIEDSGEEAEQTIKALNRLVLKHHVAAVIGPLMSKGIDQVTLRAQELGVPLISLARYSGTATSDYVFQSGLTLRMQAHEIARYAIERLGMKRFAAMYPKDKVGEESMQAFWDSVESLGGEMVGVEGYNPSETDFRQPVDKLSGLYYTEARARELDALAKERETNNIKKRTRKTEQFFSLKPIVDYDAVFIPEEPKVAGQILPTFAYRDVDKVKFLGTSAWNSNELPMRAASAAENSIFVDAFHPESASPLAKKFIEKYKATFGQDPGAMDAMAYDAARVLEMVLAENASHSNRADIRDRLKGVKNFPGVTGKISYKEGQFVRDLKILTVKTGKIVEAVAQADAPPAEVPADKKKRRN
jgi:ABC-type branched-subunit amino acid transport system substrate-binding protein